MLYGSSMLTIKTWIIGSYAWKVENPVILLHRWCFCFVHSCKVFTLEGRFSYLGVWSNVTFSFLILSKLKRWQKIGTLEFHVTAVSIRPGKCLVICNCRLICQNLWTIFFFRFYFQLYAVLQSVSFHLEDQINSVPLYFNILFLPLPLLFNPNIFIIISLYSYKSII